MDARELERVVKDSNQRLQRIEQILPTLATKEELKALATKEDLERYVTKEEWRAEVARLATKDELRAEVAKLATKEELRAELDGLREEIRSEGEKTRRHFDAVAEDRDEKMKWLAESVASSLEAYDRRFTWLGLRVADHETRITRLEATGPGAREDSE